MKKLVLILIAIFVLFGALLLYGVARDDSRRNTAERHSWLDGVGSLSGAKHHVQPGEMMIACLENSVFQVSALVPCQGRIRSSQQTIREFKLLLLAGTRVEIELHSRGKNGTVLRFPIQGEFKMSPALQVLAEGADLILRCAIPPGPALPCRLQLSA